MKILLIDNEPELRLGLQAMLQKIAPPDTQYKEADGVISGLQLIATYQPDIVFLDIEMDDGTGFDLLKQIEAPSFQLIFTTAHNQYAIQAIRFSALDYLLKPVDPAELKVSFEKAVKNIHTPTLTQQLAIVMQQLNNKPINEQRIVLNDKQSTYFIKVADILFCEAEGPYTRFYITGTDNILVSKNLKEFEEMLTPLGFLRTHHSYVANPSKIKVYDKTNGGALVLEGGHSIPVSQRRKDAVMDALAGKLK
jgi:two-component system, LytTR family, response regulator